jgi:hypothetical protein
MTSNSTNLQPANRDEQLAQVAPIIQLARELRLPVDITDTQVIVSIPLFKKVEV